MKLAFLDRNTSDLGDIDFSGIEAFGEVIYHPSTSPSEVANRIEDVDIIITNKVVIDRSAMSSAKHLKAIQIAATGVNNVDLEAAKELGIPVFNVSGYSTSSVAQHVFAKLLNLVTHVNRYAATPEKWAESPMFTRLDFPILELKGKQLGIVGYGDIGKAVARIAESFEMEVVAMARDGADDSVKRLESDTFFQSCDVITLHCPLTDSNYHMINQETLRLMKPTAYIINTGRGDLVNELDLIEALKKGEIAGAGIDVISTEPPPADHPMINTGLPNLLVTPHTAWSSVEARQRLMDGIEANLKAIQKGVDGENRVV